MINNSKNINILDHPLLKHKLSLMRDKNTESVVFRELMREAGIILGVEATRSLNNVKKDIETPLEKMEGDFLAQPEPAVISILRAGNGLLDGVLRILPQAAVGFLGMSRDHETLKPVDYYQNLPKDMKNRSVLIVDPMLATGGSAVSATNIVKDTGCSSITFMCLLAAPEGVKKYTSHHPDVRLVTGSLDRELNEIGYILPGLGDAGDRIYGT